MNTELQTDKPSTIASNSGELFSKEFDSAQLPVKLRKIIEQIGTIKQRMVEHRKEAHNMCNELSNLEKIVEKYASKIAKDQTKTHTERRKRKPSGFASPTTVSPELCSFMGKPDGSLISRTETSKFLSNYISTNRLYDENNKSVILPDQNLLKLLGETVADNGLTHFSIQKYINRHFIKQEHANVENSVSETA
jgi:chromatin remodeling complex protein RSC6